MHIVFSVCSFFFLFKKRIYLFYPICVSTLPACMMCTTEKGMRSPEAGVMDGRHASVENRARVLCKSSMCSLDSDSPVACSVVGGHRGK